MRVMITGASSGLGLQIGQLLKKNEHSIYNFSRTPSPFDDRELDLSRPDAYKVLEKATREIKPEMIILNAGALARGQIRQLAPDDLDALTYINAVSNIKYLTSVFDYLNENKVHLIVVTSIVAHLNGVLEAHYAATKHMLRAFTESLASELADAGGQSTVQEFAPPFIPGTGMTGGENEDAVQVAAEFLVKAIESGKFLLIPDYDTVYQGVIARYTRDPLQFGHDSMQYKKRKFGEEN